MNAQPRKQHLINTAYRLFNQHGYHATGIDRILEESGVSKATLYKYFRSKEELIIAVLQQRHEQLLALTTERIEQSKSKEPVLAIFDVLNEWFNSGSFFGCNFIRASGEYTQVDDIIHDYAARHKESVRQVIESHLNVKDKKGRRALSMQLALLVDGAIVRAQVTGDRNTAGAAKEIAALLLQHKYFSTSTPAQSA